MSFERDFEEALHLPDVAMDIFIPTAILESYYCLTWKYATFILVGLALAGFTAFSTNLHGSFKWALIVVGLNLVVGTVKLWARIRKALRHEISQAEQAIEDRYERERNNMLNKQLVMKFMSMIAYGKLVGISWNGYLLLVNLGAKRGPLIHFVEPLGDPGWVEELHDGDLGKMTPHPIAVREAMEGAAKAGKSVTMAFLRTVGNILTVKDSGIPEGYFQNCTSEEVEYLLHQRVPSVICTYDTPTAMLNTPRQVHVTLNSTKES